MQPDHVERFVTLVFAGSGLFLAGFVNLFTARLGGRVSTVLSVLVCLAAIGGAAAWSGASWFTGLAAVVVGSGMLVGLLLGSGSLTLVGRSIWSALSKPVVRWSLVSCAGLAIVASASAIYDIEDDAWVDRDTDEMMYEFDDPGRAHVQVTDVLLVTDKGTPIPLTVSTAPRSPAELERMERQSIERSGHGDDIIRLQPADDRSNCFGWVFTSGQYKIEGWDVDTILKENGYQVVKTPRPGDLVIYRYKGHPEHIAIVRYVTEGLPVLVESKWGWEGVYLHAVDDTKYSTDSAYYRSSRSGHVLRRSVE